MIHFNPSMTYTLNDVKIWTRSWNNISHHRNVCPPLFLSFPPLPHRLPTAESCSCSAVCPTCCLSLWPAALLPLQNIHRLRVFFQSCPTWDAILLHAQLWSECASEWIEGIPQFGWRRIEGGKGMNVVKNKALVDVMSRVRKGYVGFARLVVKLYCWRQQK